MPFAARVHRDAPAPAPGPALLSAAIAMIVVLSTTLVGAPGAIRTAAAAAAPAAPPESTADWVQVAAGGNHTCGIRTSGRLYCWGDDTFGQLGDGPGATDDQLAPVEVAGGLTTWASVAAGGDTTCGIRVNGKLFCWGEDFYGQVGDGGDNQDRAAPVAIQPRSTATWAAVDLGESHTCALRTTGRLFCWGLNGNGQLGNDDPNVDQTVPSQVAGSLTTWASLSAGGHHSCGIRANGRLYCWGRGVDGELGDFRGTDQPVPSLVYAANNPQVWRSVAAGAFHTCAITTGNRMACWGNDSDGQLGNGSSTTDNQLKPVFFTLVSESSWVSVTAGDYLTCARKTSLGRLFCWGDDSAGQVGNGVPFGDQSRPTEVAGGSTTWTQATAGGFHTCALKSSGRLFCWGYDESGQVGDAGTPTDRPTPTQVA